MTNDELLLAISDMIDPLREDMRGMKGDILELKQDVSELKQDVQEIKIRVKKMELTQENKVLPRLNTIESCYISTYDRYRDSVEDYEVMKLDISVLKTVVAEHSGKLQRLECV